MEWAGTDRTDIAVLCSRCGCHVPPQGQQQHDAWHEFVESGIAELVAAVATLDGGRPRPS